MRGDKSSMFIEIDGMDQSKCSMPNPGRFNAEHSPSILTNEYMIMQARQKTGRTTLATHSSDWGDADRPRCETLESVHLV